jgi:hypothetical protein
MNHIQYKCADIQIEPHMSHQRKPTHAPQEGRILSQLGRNDIKLSQAASHPDGATPNSIKATKGQKDHTSHVATNG